MAADCSDPAQIPAPTGHFQPHTYQELAANADVVSNLAGYTLSMAKGMVSRADELLAEIDSEVRRRATTRSAWLALAARQQVRRRDPDDVAAAIARSEVRFASAGSFESADILRSDRDARR